MNRYTALRFPYAYQGTDIAPLQLITPDLDFSEWQRVATIQLNSHCSTGNPTGIDSVGEIGRLTEWLSNYYSAGIIQNGHRIVWKTAWATAICAVEQYDFFNSTGLGQSQLPPWLITVACMSCCGSSPSAVGVPVNSTTGNPAEIGRRLCGCPTQCDVGNNRIGVIAGTTNHFYFSKRKRSVHADPHRSPCSTKVDGVRRRWWVSIGLAPHSVSILVKHWNRVIG